MKEALIVAVTDATCAVAKRKLEKIRLVRDSNSRVYNDPTQWTAPSWLLAQLVERCPGFAEVKGSNPVQPRILSGFLFETAKGTSITALIFVFLKKVISVDYARGVPTKYSLDTLSFYGVKYIRRWPQFLLATVLFAFLFHIKEVLTSGSQYWVHAYPIKLVAAGGAWDYVDWCPGIRVVMSRHCIIKHWPEAFVWVLMRLYNDVHTILEKNRFEARRSENSNNVTRFLPYPKPSPTPPPLGR